MWVPDTVHAYRGKTIRHYIIAYKPGSGSAIGSRATSAKSAATKIWQPGLSTVDGSEQYVGERWKDRMQDVLASELLPSFARFGRVDSVNTFSIGLARTASDWAGFGVFPRVPSVCKERSRVGVPRRAPQYRRSERFKRLTVVDFVNGLVNTLMQQAG